MLLAVNVGNSQTAIGIVDGETILEHWRVSTRVDRTPDEYRLQLRGLIAEYTGIGLIDQAAVASVVPAVTQSIGAALSSMVEHTVVVGPGVKTGMPMSVDNPREVGADRVASAVAAKERFGSPVVIVSFGTAITVDVVDSGGAFIGGVIAPGLDISLDALVDSTAALRRVALIPPSRVIGGNTVEAIQSGMLFGFAGLVDGLVGKVLADLGSGASLVATGERVATLVPLLGEAYEVDEFLALRGLSLLNARNQ